MRVLCGTDIIEINRIKDNIEELKEHFLNKIYTEKEIEYCESKNMQKYQHYAARFAAKEAVTKAVSELLQSKFDISWKNIEIINKDEGKPTINFVDINIEGIKSIDLSISHSREYATAFVVILAD